MLSIIPSSKSLDFETKHQVEQGSEPKFSLDSKQLLQLCKNLSKEQIKKLMHISDNLAEVNYQRFHAFENHPQKQAIFAYNGDVYDPIEKYSFTSQQIGFMQEHICIASGLYGLLKPLDYIRPYRLEMAIKLGGMSGDKDLSNFWRPIVTNHIMQVLGGHKNKYLINLASMEYSAVINKEMLKDKIINIYFKENKGGQLKTVAIYAKRARGMMVNFIIKNLIDEPQELKGFKEAGYQFNLLESSDYDWVFIR